MNKLIDRATAHFEQVLSQGLKGPINVPEWDVDVYYKPSSTMAEEAKIIELTQQGKSTEALVQTLVAKARDKEGTLLFEASDKVRLMRAVDPAVILKVVSAMNTEVEATEEALGN